MCGIAGIFNFGGTLPPPSQENITAMAATLRHRGPDEFGIYRDHRAALGHARLSIIDLAGGSQPLCNEDETIWIVFNGEIFNYPELRQQLISNGHRFRTDSDTEVIVHAYEEWGADCFRHFNGQWALAILDTAKERLVLSRDRMGIRPLYILESGSGLAFASEVKALAAHSGASLEISPEGLAQTFAYWGPVAPQTVFKGIEELPPAAVRTYDAAGQSRQHIFWSPDFRIDPQYAAAKPDETAAILREKLAEATRLRTLRADVPVGSYLSGGLDSSVIAWLGHQAKAGEFRTFSLRFTDAEFDETHYQRLMAQRLNSCHQEVAVKRSDIAEIFPQVIYHTERPVLRTAPAPMFLLSKLVRECGIKSVLTGEGADEVLAGYDIFREAKLRRFWARQPHSTCRPRLFDRIYPYLARAPQQARGMALAFWGQHLEDAEKPGFSHSLRWGTAASLRRFLNPEFAPAPDTPSAPPVPGTLPKDFNLWPRLGQDQFLEILTLFGPYLISSQGDRMLMANSVEGRFPFLDVNVMEFCNHLPPSHRLHVLDEKYILKKAAADFVPPEIITRKKQPYRAPDAISFVDKNAPDYVAELLAENAVKDAGIFDARKVARLHTKLRATARNTDQPVFSNADNMAFVGILSTQLLARAFTDRSHRNASEIRLSVNVNRAV